MTSDLLAVHVLAAVPLAAVIGLKLAGRPLAWAGLAIGFVVWGMGVADWSETLAVRAAVRTGTLAAVLTPLVAVVAGLLPRTTWPTPTRLGAAVAGLVAVAVPALAAERAASAGTAEARRLILANRPLAASQVLARVVELDPGRMMVVNGTRIRLLDLHAELEQTVAKLQSAADEPLAAPIAPVDRYDRAGVLLALDRPADVVRLLRGHVDRSPRGRLRLAEAHAELGQWAEAAELCRSAADATRPFADRDSRTADVRRQALDRLADALSRQGDRDGAEAALREGADTLPAFAGQFHLRLGQLYRTTGRPLAALAELREAARSDPSLAAQAAGVEREIREQTPGCLLRRE